MSQQKKLKIAFIHPDLGIGGAERLVLDLAVSLSKEKHEILFITNHFDKNHAFDELKSGQFPVQVIGDWIPRSIFGKCMALCAYIRMIYLSLVYVLFMRKNDNPDLYVTDLIPVAHPILKLCNEKIVYYCHHPDLLASAPGGSLKKLYRKPLDWFEMKATSIADNILVNSEYTASIFRKTFPEITKPIQILYPTIASSYQETVAKLKTPTPITELLPELITTSTNNIVFLSLNRFHPAKKLELGVLAMKKLKDMVTSNDWDRIFFIMAGGYDPQSTLNAETYDQLENLSSELNLSNKVIFLKSPSDDLKAELLFTCTCLVYTPVNEHFGIVPLEAMLVGKPVIACNSGGPRETVEHGKTGFLCEPNPESMAVYMKKILEADVKTMGTNGKSRLEKNFSQEIFSKCLNRAIGETIDGDKKTD